MSSSSRDPLLLRTARRADDLALARLSTRAFTVVDLDGWQRWYAEHGRRRPSDTLVAVEPSSGSFLGAVTALRLELSLAGKTVPVRGISAVSVLPEARQRGVAGRLMRAWLRRMQRRGDALTMLYPFREGYYARFGYGRCESAERLVLRPTQLAPSPLARGVRPLDREQDAPTLAALYDRWREGRTGPLVRDAWWWRARVLERVDDGVLFVHPERGVPEGYALLKRPREPGALGRQHLHVRELVATTPDAQRGLLGFLHAQREQVARLEWTCAPGEGLLHVQHDDGVLEESAFTVLKPTGTLELGAMARLVDPVAGLAMHPAAQRTDLDFGVGLDLEDPVLHPRARYLDLVWGPAGLVVGDGSRARPRLSLTAGQLGGLFFGHLRAEALLRAGYLQGDAEAAARLDHALAGPPCHLGVMNSF